MNPLARGNLAKSVSDAGGTGLAADARSLDAMRRAARDNPQVAIKQAAKQFEALFMQMVLKSMRDATPKSGMLDSDAQETYTGMLDQQLATKIAASGTGLADVIAKQLGQQMKGQVAAAAANAPTAPVSAIGPKPPTAAPAPGAANDSRDVEPIDPYLPSRFATQSVRNAYAAIRVLADDAGKSGAVATATSSVPAAAGTALNTNGDAAAAPDASSRDFISRHWGAAQSAARASGVPANFILGQAALESGWGRQEIRGSDGAPSHNLFGIKAGTNWQGPTVDVVTTEYEGGAAVKKIEKFRSYSSYGEAFGDWAKLVGGNPRFANVVRAGADAAGFAGHMQRTGYATDPHYGSKLMRVINAVRALVRPT